MHSMIPNPTACCPLNPVPVQCCPGKKVPRSLKVTFWSVGCPGFQGEAIVTYDETNVDYWRAAPLPICGGTLELQFYCQGGGDWILDSQSLDAGPCYISPFGGLIADGSPDCDMTSFTFHSDAGPTNGPECGCCGDLDLWEVGTIEATVGSL